MKQSVIRLLAIIFLSAQLISCENSDKTEVMHHAVAIESGDECHLCGMIISNFPGPKGELYSRGEDQVKKFCSTRDLFAYLLQPENTHRSTQVFVHDMASNFWDKPDDERFIDARTAFYVIDHSQQGAMGPTLASFESKSDAEKFSQIYGGSVITFSDITIDLLSKITRPEHEGMHSPPNSSGGEQGASKVHHG